MPQVFAMSVGAASLSMPGRHSHVCQTLGASFLKAGIIFTAAVRLHGESFHYAVALELLQPVNKPS
jgi:hypothetical protein